MLSARVWHEEQRSMLLRFVIFLFFPQAGQGSFLVVDVIVPVSAGGDVFNRGL